MKKAATKPPAVARKSRAVSGFKQRFIEAEGLTIRCSEGGRGAPIVLIVQAETDPALTKLLAGSFRVTALAVADAADAPVISPEAQRRQARALGQAATAAGRENYVLAAASNDAVLALWQAVEAPDQVAALVLIAPSGLAGAQNDSAGAELTPHLAALKVPTLVLLGTDEAVPAAIARTWAERIPTSYVTLIYDAGTAIAAERPQALLAAIHDFVDQRERFVVNRASTAIHP